jgi:tetratricopeptide (TPR) repeat protein
MALTHMTPNRGTGSTTLAKAIKTTGGLVTLLLLSQACFADKNNGEVHISKERAADAYSRGMQSFKAGKMDAAADALCDSAKVVETEDGKTRAKYNVACATAIMQTPDWEGAEIFFQAAQKADGSYPQIYSGWGSLAERKGDYATAAENYEHYLGLEHDPGRHATFEKRLAAVKAKAPHANIEAASTTKPSPQSSLAVVDAGDCAKVCDKLLQCKAGPWSSKDDCMEACDGAREDRVASKTYRCAAQAKTCKAVSSCGR